MSDLHYTMENIIKKTIDLVSLKSQNVLHNWMIKKEINQRQNNLELADLLYNYFYGHWKKANRSTYVLVFHW